MSRISRIIRKVIIGMAIAIVGLVTVLIAINSFDEKLDPGTEALLIPTANHSAPADNIYVSLAGLDAPSGHSVIEAGQARIAFYNKKIDAMSTRPLDGSVLSGEKSERLAFKGDFSFCQPLRGSYLSEIPNHEAELSALFAVNHELYLRYLALHGKHGYYETMHPSHLAPYFYAPNQARCLFLADFAMRIQSGRALEQQKAIADFEDDVHLWRLMLIGEGSILSKIMAVSSLRADYLMLADIIADQHTRIDTEALEGGDLVSIFEPGDWKIGSAYAMEFRRAVTLWTQLKNTPSPNVASEHDSTGIPVRWWHQLQNAYEGPFFFKLHATENLGARQMSLLIKMANADPTQFNEARDQYRNWVKEHEVPVSPRFIFNPLGNIMVAIAVPAYEDYITQVYDCAAVQRLTRLGYEIRRQGVVSAAIPAFLQRHPEWATHQLDGRPFLWNGQKREITVQVVSPRSDRRFTIPIWQPSPSGS